MGMTKRRSFAPKYKAEAVDRLNESGGSYGSVLADLGVTPTQLKTWYLERAAAGSEAALARKKTDAEKLTRLRRENERLNEENEILQKASALAVSLGPMALWRPTSRARQGRHDVASCLCRRSWHPSGKPFNYPQVFYSGVVAASK